MNERGASTALLTDHYELTMLAGALADGTAERPCVFEVFARRLPTGRRYGVVAGQGRLMELIRDFRFTAVDIEFLLGSGIILPFTASLLIASAAPPRAAPGSPDHAPLAPAIGAGSRSASAWPDSVASTRFADP